MKMKVLLSVIVFTLYTVSYAQNMKMIDTSMPKKDKKDAVVIEYDSLTNIRPYKDASYSSNPQLSSSASFLRLNVLSSLN